MVRITTRASPSVSAGRPGTAALLLVMLGSPLAAQPSGDDAPLTRLGQALFVDQRFTNPAADYEASCSGCHALGENLSGRPARFFADYVPLSMTATKQTTLRNTPSLIDVGRWSRFGLDGAYESLEEMITGKLTGGTMGWGPGDRTRARDAIQFTLLEEGDSRTGESYVDLFAAAYEVDLEAVSGDRALELAAQALADYARGIVTTETAVWDAFRTQNRIHAGPAEGEPAKSYAGGVEGRLGNLEGRLQIKRPEGFTQEAYRGFRTFFRTWGEESVGNCVTCHTPPHFTDFELHNTGIAEVEYEAVHGEGSFEQLEIGGERPRASFLARPSAEHPGQADLGYWNHAPEGEDLEAVLGAFKTPSLRNLERTDPYMHNGAYASLEEAVAEIVRVNQLARAGKMRAIDPEYRVMNLGSEDVAPLVAFLRQLGEVGEERFRYYLIHLEQD